MYEFKTCFNFIYTRSHSSAGCMLALSWLHLKFDFVWSLIVFAEKSFLISWDTGIGDYLRYLNWQILGLALGSAKNL